jgi:hypothetical protein
MATPKPVPPTCPNRALSLESETLHRGFWDCVVPADHTLEMVLEPSYFGRVCSEEKAKGQLCVGDYIGIEPEHGDWYVRVRVMAFNRALTRCVTRMIGEPVRFDVEVTKGYEIKWRGANLRWVIQHGEEQIAGGFASKTEAQIKLDEMLADSRRAA